MRAAILVLGLCSSAAARPKIVIDDPVRGKPTGKLGLYTTPDVMRVLKSRLAIWKACYRRELNRNPTLRGRLIVQFKIDDDGHVVTARVQQSTVRNDVLEGCVIRNVQRLRFRTTGQPAQITYPFLFSIS